MPLYQHAPPPEAKCNLRGVLHLSWSNAQEKTRMIEDILFRYVALPYWKRLSTSILSSQQERTWSYTHNWLGRIYGPSGNKISVIRILFLNRSFSMDHLCNITWHSLRQTLAFRLRQGTISGTYCTSGIVNFVEDHLGVDWCTRRYEVDEKSTRLRSRW